MSEDISWSWIETQIFALAVNALLVTYQDLQSIDTFQPDNLLTLEFSPTS